MVKYNIAIFLPSAGLGERLRPITNHLPKPLLPILGKPIIEGILEKLTAVCTGRIGVNLHYKPEMIRDWIERSPYADRVTYFPEDPILGTGGALKNAEEFLANGHFVVHNSDILLDIDFARLVETHLSSGNIASLVTHKHPKLSNVVVDESGYVLDVENPGDSRPNPDRIARKVAYTGIALYSPEILKFLPPGVSHATVAWMGAAKAGQKVQALDFTGSYWLDIGNPATYASGILDSLGKNGETVFLSPTAKCGSIEINGYVVVEGKANIHDGTRLRNCIVMPGAQVSGEHENRILGPDYTIDLDEAEMQPGFHAIEQKRVTLSDPLFACHFDMNGQPVTPDKNDQAEAILIGLGGSDRRYFRVRNDGRTAVLLECKPDDQDYERHLVYTRFFAAHSVPVPGLIATDIARKKALFHDLGDTSLYSYLKIPHSGAHVYDVYCSVLDILVKFHTRVTEHVHECPLLQARIFDYDYLLWETGYFLERFVVGLKKLPLDHKQALEEEFHRLAMTVDAYPKSVIHRDFQCQNIMITKGGIPHVIDYQGARMAPVAYDIASVLWDPYHRLDNGVRERLIEYYISEMKRHLAGFNESLFKEGLVPCRLQRHMQALGAYGFLSVVKGKKYFLKHIPEALRLLKEDAAAVKKEFPELHKLMNRLE
ncbi:MAG TPA: sugar phosphate nucleotidyltransferase [Nitrospirota bacterium]|nr:sugar phosphate nucleotidyltransferase [Nitrospirota bacterium]